MLIRMGIHTSFNNFYRFIAKTNVRRRRPRTGNIDGQTLQTTTPHEDASRSQENVDQRGDSPINVVDMP